MLAETTGGQVFQPTASRELAAIYQTILDELGSQYVLGYTSDNTKRDGRFRRITVELKRPRAAGAAPARLRRAEGRAPAPGAEEVAAETMAAARPTAGSSG